MAINLSRLHRHVSDIIRAGPKLPSRRALNNADDSAILEAEREYQRLMRTWRTFEPDHGFEEEEWSRLSTRAYQMMDRIYETPAAGLAGAFVKVRRLTDPNSGILDQIGDPEATALRDVFAVIARELGDALALPEPAPAPLPPAMENERSTTPPKRMPAIYWYTHFGRRHRGQAVYGDHEFEITFLPVAVFADNGADRWVLKHWWPDMPKNADGHEIWPERWGALPWAPRNNCTAHFATNKEAVAAVKAIISSLMAAPGGNVVPLLPRSTDEPGPDAA